MDLTFENILSHINTVYVLRTRPGAYDRGRAATEEPEFNALRLKVLNLSKKVTNNQLRAFSRVK